MNRVDAPLHSRQLTDNSQLKTDNCIRYNPYMHPHAAIALCFAARAARAAASAA